MDKGKNRTDLLAAGRKKLQQFRQKKDGKGSKSSGKVGKSEHDIDADSASTATTEIKSEHHLDTQAADSYASLSHKYSMATDIDAPTTDSSSVPALLEEVNIAKTSTATKEIKLEHHLDSKAADSYASQSHDYSMTTDIDATTTDSSSVPALREEVDTAKASTATEEIKSEHHLDSKAADSYASQSQEYSMATNIDATTADSSSVPALLEEVDIAKASSATEEIKLERHLDSKAADSYASQSHEYLVSTDIDATTTDSPSVPALLEEVDLAKASHTPVESSLEDTGVGMSGLDINVGKVYVGTSTYEGETAHEEESKSVVPVPSEILESGASEERSKHAGTSMPIGLSVSSNLVNLSEGVAIAAKMEHADEEVQEAGGSGSKPVDRSSGLNPEGGGKLFLFEHVNEDEDYVGTAPGKTCVEEATYESGENGNPNNPSASTDARIDAEVHEVGLHQVSDQFFSQMNKSTSLNPGAAFQYIDVVPDSSYESYIKEDVQSHIPDKIVDVDRSIISTDIVSSLQSRIVNILSGADVISIGLSELAEVLCGLDEDEIGFLLALRKVPPAELRNSGNLNAAEYDACNFWERIKEQLYVTNCAKDIFHSQLGEQLELQMELHNQYNQLVDELSMANASLDDVRVKNESLVEELAQCRSLLKDVSIEREVAHEQLHTANAEAAEFEVRIDELEMKLRKSEANLSLLSTELSDCKDLMAPLQLENEKLNGSLNSVTEERRELVEEKANIARENEKMTAVLVECNALLALLQLENVNGSVHLSLLDEERRKLEEEKEQIVSENYKILSDMEDCRRLAEALQVENANINGILNSVMEEKTKLIEEKEHLTHDIERISTEVIGLSNLVDVIWLEISNLNGNHASVEQKKYLVNENDEKLTSFTDCECLIADLHVKCCRAVDELKEASLHLKRLTEENLHLKSLLDMHKSEIHIFDNQQVKLPLLLDVAASQVQDSRVLSASEESDLGNYDFHQIPGKGEIESSHVFEKPASGSQAENLPSEKLKINVYDDSLGFIAIKHHLVEAENVMQNLEKAIERMHFYSTSLTRSSSKPVSPGISKLIQAFESKAYSDDNDLEETPPIEDQSFVGPYMVIKEQLKILRSLFEELSLDAVKAGELHKGERSNKRLVEIAFSEYKVHNEALDGQCRNLEESNIELVVLHEVAKQRAYIIEAKNTELEIMCETIKQQEITLKKEKNELGKKVIDFQERITKLQRQVEETCRNSDEIVSSVFSQVDALRQEVSEKAFALEQEWDSMNSLLVESVKKLDATIDFHGLTFPIGAHDGLDIGSRIAASIDAVIKVIEDLLEKLKAAHQDRESIRCANNERNEIIGNLMGKNQLATALLHRVYNDLRKLVSNSCEAAEDSRGDDQNEVQLDPPLASDIDNLMEQLGKVLGERLLVESLNNDLHSQLMDRTRVIDELNKRCLGSDAILKLIEEVECVVKLEGIEINTDEPASCLGPLIIFLVQKYKETSEQLSFFGDVLGSKEMEETQLQEQIDQLTWLVFQCDTDIFILKESLRTAEEVFVATYSQLQEKGAELGQSEQRVSSLREKLGIAVTKGKGLIVQRDGLKQSLAETSSELEKCLHDLQLKDARVNELETKLKTYSEAGERVEALESELSYIRNSATALRESFLLKDSVLQRIEEILEELELPEHFHSRGITEKVDWLARSVTANSLPLPDWDQKNTAEVGSCSESGFVVMDPWKEDAQPNSGDDLRRKFEELQNKFYGLAEQNEMLEQSLMERNNLMHRWEEILNSIDMPPQFRSMEPEQRIGWLGAAISEAQNHCDYLQQKIDNLETFCGSLTADLNESQQRVSNLEEDFKSVLRQKEDLSKRLEILTCDHDGLSSKVAQFEVENDKLQSEVTSLQNELDEKVSAEARLHAIEGEVRRLQDLLFEALQYSVTEDLVVGSDSTDYLGQLVRELVEKYTILSLRKPDVEEVAGGHFIEKVDMASDEMRLREVDDTEKQDIVGLRQKIEVALDELMLVKEERDKLVENNKFLLHEVDEGDMKRQQLQELLNQEEQKVSSLRDKLNVAVRKGKTLVQQRDSLKKTVEEFNSEVERLRSEIRLRENSLSEYEEKVKDLSAYQERVEAVEAEKLLLRNHLAETENYLQENAHNLSRILNALSNVDVGFELNVSDPVEKLEKIGKLSYDLRETVNSSEHESRKAKRAAELLLAELNEVQERNDAFQEELAEASNALALLSKERDLAEASGSEALANLDKLSALRSEERNKQFTQLMGLKSGAGQLREGVFAVKHLLGNILSQNLSFLHDLEGSMKSCLQPIDASNVFGFDGAPGNSIRFSNSLKKVSCLPNSGSDPEMQDPNSESFVSEICSFVEHYMEDMAMEMNVLKERLFEHSDSFHEEASTIYEIVGTFHREMSSRKESFESLKSDISRLESSEKERHMELLAMSRNLSLLYKTCDKLINEIETWKAEQVGNGLSPGPLGADVKFSPYFDGGNDYSGQTLLYSEDSVRIMADRLALVVKNLIGMKTEIAEVGHKEMKLVISNLQRELQEKDIQKERISLELVSQIKDAEAAAKAYMQDLQPAKDQVLDLETRVHVMEKERSILEKRIEELQAQEALSLNLEEGVKLLTDTLAMKEQEIEALMQALDEEENQMEGLTIKNEELEKVLEQKNLELENLEASRGKAMKKLSITVSKFDELHHLSAGLLSEVERLQSQLQDRDAEISFLRQEVARCANDALVASQSNNQRNADEIHEFLMWLVMTMRPTADHNTHFNDTKSSQVDEYKDILQKHVMSMLSELEDLRTAVQNRDRLLQLERSRVEDLKRKGEFLENSLHEKESELSMLHGVGDSRLSTSVTSEIMEVEPMINKRAVPGTSVTPQVRSVRKANNDQVAIAIDVDQGTGGSVEDEDDDKAHGFKSLTTSRVVPRFTRPVTDIIDGLWVSCDRALMRQPALRLGVIIYWAILHALVAAFVV